MHLQVEFSFSLLAAFIIIGCSDDGVLSESLSSDSVTGDGISFSAAPISRTATIKNAWQSGDQVAIFYKASDSSISDAYCYGVGVDGTMMAMSNSISEDVEATEFYAFYPYDSALTSYADYQAREKNNTSTVDCMNSSSTMSGDAVIFTFSHVYSKVTFNFFFGKEYSDSDTFTAELATDATTTLALSVENCSASLFILPQAAIDENFVLTVTDDSSQDEYTFNLADYSSISSWSAGEYYTYSSLVLGSEPEVAYIQYRRNYSTAKNMTLVDEDGVIASILSKFRRCLAKSDGVSGEMTIAYLDGEDSNYYEDGTEADLTGAEGDVMVYFPEYWYCYREVDATYYRYYYSELPIDGGVHVPASLVGAYKASYSTNADATSEQLVSFSDRSVAATISYANCLLKSAARGKGYQIIDYNHHCVIAQMLYAKYLDRNIQLYAGFGTASYTGTSYIFATGSTNELGNVDSTSDTKGYVSGLGLEGVYGAYYEYLQGVSVASRVWTIDNVDGTQRTVEGYSSSAYIRYMVGGDNVDGSYGGYFDMVPAYAYSSSAYTTYYADYYAQAASGVCVKRGYCGYSSNHAGVAAIDASATAVTAATTSTATRLAFRGAIVEAASVAEFKAIDFELLPIESTDEEE